MKRLFPKSLLLFALFISQLVDSSAQAEGKYLIFDKPILVRNGMIEKTEDLSIDFKVALTATIDPTFFPSYVEWAKHVSPAILEKIGANENWFKQQRLLRAKGQSNRNGFRNLSLWGIAFAHYENSNFVIAIVSLNAFLTKPPSSKEKSINTGTRVFKVLESGKLQYSSDLPPGIIREYSKNNVEAFQKDEKLSKVTAIYYDKKKGEFLPEESSQAVFIARNKE